MHFPRRSTLFGVFLVVLTLIVLSLHVPGSGMMPVSSVTQSQPAWKPGQVSAASSYSYSYISQSPGGPLTMNTPQTFEVKLRNTGTQPWYRAPSSLGCSVNLGTGEPGGSGTYRTMDHISPFYTPGASGWLEDSEQPGASGRRIKMLEYSVWPGQVATFRFSATVPNVSGQIYEYWTPVVEGAACGSGQWLPSIGIHFQITVAPSYSYSYVSQTPSGSFTLTTPQTFEVKLRNTGNQAWYRAPSSGCSVNLGTGEPGGSGTYRAMDHISPFYTPGAFGWLEDSEQPGASGRRIKMLESSVPPDGIATFRFSATVPNVSGQIYEYWTPVVEGAACGSGQWLPSIGIHFQVTVVR